MPETPDRRAVPDAKKISWLVAGQSQHPTKPASAVMRAFPPRGGPGRLIEKAEVSWEVHTLPTHGSWLKHGGRQKLGSFGFGQCLGTGPGFPRSPPTKPKLNMEGSCIGSAWGTRNTGMNMSDRLAICTTADAGRFKLSKRFNPVIELSIPDGWTH